LNQACTAGYRKKNATSKLLVNPNHVVDKDTFLAACPQLQQLGFIQDFGTKVLQNGAHTYVVPLTVDDYGRGTLALETLMQKYHVRGSLPSIKEYAAKKTPQAMSQAPSSSSAGFAGGSGMSARDGPSESAVCYGDASSSRLAEDGGFT
jgi:hypothetical protein